MLDRNIILFFPIYLCSCHCKIDLHFLQDHDFSHPDLIRPAENFYTVVIFTSKIRNSQQSKVELQHIDWPSSGKFSNENGALIVSTIYNIYTGQLKLKKPLRIVCIDALDPNGELSSQTAKDILNYLKQNIKDAVIKGSSAIDVIILPKFKPILNDSGDVIESLWYLRKRAVLITNSSLHVTLPGTEIIAVAAETEQQSRPASVIDFVVTGSKKEWLTFDLAKSLGPAVAAALALGFLHCLRELDARAVKGIKNFNYFLLFYFCVGLRESLMKRNDLI